ncbi:MAG: acyltransferase family protein [Agriterribacter sp.]
MTNLAVQKYYKPELDVLRLCAFLFVFFVHRMDLAPVDAEKYFWGYHISLVGNYGVPLFYFLSAFLITELLTREQERFGKSALNLFILEESYASGRCILRSFLSLFY